MRKTLDYENEIERLLDMDSVRKALESKENPSKNKVFSHYEKRHHLTFAWNNNFGSIYYYAS